MRHLSWAPLLCAVMAGAAAFAAPHHRPQVVTITVDKMAFGAPSASLHVGDAVQWDNRDIFQHSATAADHSFDVELPVGAHGRTVLRRAGTISYTCRYHPGMKAQLKVER